MPVLRDNVRFAIVFRVLMSLSRTLSRVRRGTSWHCCEDTLAADQPGQFLIQHPLSPRADPFHIYHMRHMMQHVPYPLSLLQSLQACCA